jgi:PhnB protein
MENRKNVSLNPYLTFTGNCREAMTFYKESLNSDLEMNPFEGAPMEVPSE